MFSWCNRMRAASWLSRGCLWRRIATCPCLKSWSERSSFCRTIRPSLCLKKIGECCQNSCRYMYTYKWLKNEFRAIKHLLDVLTPYSTESGGPLKLDHVVFVEGRGNLIIEYTPEGASGMTQQGMYCDDIIDLWWHMQQVQLPLLAPILMLSLLTLRPGRGILSSW